MRGLDAPDKMKIFSSSMQWIIEASQCFVNIDSLKWPKNAIRTAPKTWFYCYLHSVVSKTLFFPSNFLHPPFFSSVAKSAEQVLVDIVSRHYIYMYVCMYILIDMLRRTNHAPRRRMHSVANACHFMYMNHEEPSSMRLLYHEE